MVELRRLDSRRRRSRAQRAAGPA